MAIFFNVSRDEIWRISVGVLVLVLATFLRLLRKGLALAHREVLGGRLGRAGGWLGPALAREARGYDGEDSWSQLGNVPLSLVWFNRRRGQGAASNVKQPWSSLCVTDFARWSPGVTKRPGHGTRSSGTMRIFNSHAHHSKTGWMYGVHSMEQQRRLELGEGLGRGLAL